VSSFDDLFDAILGKAAAGLTSPAYRGHREQVRVICRACNEAYDEGGVPHSCSLIDRDYRPVQHPNEAMRAAKVRRLRRWGVETYTRGRDVWAPGWLVGALAHEPMDPVKRDAFIHAALKDSDLRAAAEAAHRLRGAPGVAALIWEHEA
jgi:hypothetical protein